MIDPVIFSFKLIGDFALTLRWYGVLVMLGAVAGAWLAEKEISRRGENGETIWDALIWVLPAGIIGARLWYVLNDILGGHTYYQENPIKILYVWEGGLHFFGGLLLGAIALFIFLKRNNMDIWLFLDAIAPAALLGQAIARPANFINQELYGQPTQLPWGIPIEMLHRIPLYMDLAKYPVETTRFHPTFAYEMILNFIVVLFLLWASLRYKENMKPGAIFASWLILAGISRIIIEMFRPDQPRIPGTDISYTTLVAALMSLTGMVMLLIRYGKLPFAENWEQAYVIGGQDPSPQLVAESPAMEETSQKPAPIKKNTKPRPSSKDKSVKKPAKAKSKN